MSKKYKVDITAYTVVTVVADNARDAEINAIMGVSQSLPPNMHVKAEVQLTESKTDKTNKNSKL